MDGTLIDVQPLNAAIDSHTEVAVVGDSKVSSPLAQPGAGCLFVLPLYQDTRIFPPLRFLCSLCSQTTSD